jgi:hypothetical protein
MRRSMRATAVAGALAVLATSCGRIGDNREPWCRPVPATELMAVSVPSASLVPCVHDLPAGWTFDGFQASDTGSTFVLAGPPETAARAVVGFLPACPAPEGEAVRTDEDGTGLVEDVRRRSPYAARWTYRFDGGCARIDLDLPPGDVDAGTQEFVQALSFVARDSLE